MATFELTKKSGNLGGLPEGFKLYVKSKKTYGWPNKDEYLAALEAVPNWDKLKNGNDLVGFNWSGFWDITNVRY